MATGPSPTLWALSLPVRHSASSYTRGEQIWSQLCPGERKKKHDRRRADPAIQGNVFAPAKAVSKLMASDFYMAFGTSF